MVLISAGWEGPMEDPRDCVETDGRLDTLSSSEELSSDEEEASWSFSGALGDPTTAVRTIF